MHLARDCSEERTNGNPFWSHLTQTFETFRWWRKAHQTHSLRHWDPSGRWSRRLWLTARWTREPQSRKSVPSAATTRCNTTPCSCGLPMKEPRFSTRVPSVSTSSEPITRRADKRHIYRWFPAMYKYIALRLRAAGQRFCSAHFYNWFSSCFRTSFTGVECLSENTISDGSGFMLNVNQKHFLASFSVIFWDYHSFPFVGSYHGQCL